MYSIKITEKLFQRFRQCGARQVRTRKLFGLQAGDTAQVTVLQNCPRKLERARLQFPNLALRRSASQKSTSTRFASVKSIASRTTSRRSALISGLFSRHLFQVSTP